MAAAARRPAAIAARGAIAGPQPKIEELLKEGQEIVVQVAKEPLGTKGARLTSHATLAGRFLVFMPTVDHVGVSRKIESRDERNRLRGIVKKFREEHGFGGGVIIRTAAGGRPEADILSDLDYFNGIWKDTRHKFETSRAPAVIYREQSLVAKLLRDLLTEEFSAIRIDNPQEHRHVMDLIARIMPNLASRVKLYTKDYPIFEEYGVQAEIDKALKSKVWLKSGGSIVINQTEALVAIDVNTGRYVGKRTGRLEDTIVKTNLEAVKEIVRQIRLRDLGGIIVLDFIDMEERKNRQKVFQAVELEAEEGSLAVEDAAGLGLRARHPDAQAREAEPRARADRAVPVLLGHRHHQVELDDLLRDSVGSEEDRRRPQRRRSRPARQPGDRARAEGRGARGDGRPEAGARQGRDYPAGYAPAPRAVRSDVAERSVHRH